MWTPKKATVREIIKHMDRVYDVVDPVADLITKLYDMKQEKGEKVGNYMVHMETIVSQIRERDPKQIPEDMVELLIKARLFRGLKKSL